MNTMQQYLHKTIHNYMVYKSVQHFLVIEMVTCSRTLSVYLLKVLSYLNLINHKLLNSESTTRATNITSITLVIVNKNTIENMYNNTTHVM